jgi:hypothetical protein
VSWCPTAGTSTSRCARASVQPGENHGNFGLTNFCLNYAVAEVPVGQIYVWLCVHLEGILPSSAAGYKLLQSCTWHCKTNSTLCSLWLVRPGFAIKIYKSSDDCWVRFGGHRGSRSNNWHQHSTSRVLRVGSPGNSDCRTSMTPKYLTPLFFLFQTFIWKKSRLGKAVTGDLDCKVN